MRKRVVHDCARTNEPRDDRTLPGKFDDLSRTDGSRTPNLPVRVVVRGGRALPSSCQPAPTPGEGGPRRSIPGPLTLRASTPPDHLRRVRPGTFRTIQTQKRTPVSLGSGLPKVGPPSIPKDTNL